MATVEQALAHLQRSAFRAKFHLSEQDRQYIADKGMETIQRHAADFIRTRLERVSWPLDASVSAMTAYDLIFGAAAFAGLCAGVSDLFSHIEQINSGLPANRGRILKDLAMILVPAFFVALPLMLL